jgi:hypothetical protein
VSSFVQKSGDMMSGNIGFTDWLGPEWESARLTEVTGQVRLINKLDGKLEQLIVDHPQDQNAAATKQYADQKVAKTGDTMSGDLILSKDTTAYLRTYSDGHAGMLVGSRAGKTRWLIAKNPDVESGGNAGSSLTVNRYADDGSPLGSAMLFDRATGLATVSGNPTAALGIATKGYVDRRADSEHAYAWVNNSTASGTGWRGLSSAMTPSGTQPIWATWTSTSLRINGHSAGDVFLVVYHAIFGGNMNIGIRLAMGLADRVQFSSINGSTGMSGGELSWIFRASNTSQIEIVPYVVHNSASTQNVTLALTAQRL